MGKIEQLIHVDRKEIRPFIKGLIIDSSMSLEEKFQNETLRPILKMQHHLFVQHFYAYLVTKKCDFPNLTEKEKVNFIDAAFKRDISFKSELQGMVVGHFTVDEYIVYATNKRDFNKRISTMIQQRIQSAIDFI